MVFFEVVRNNSTTTPLLQHQPKRVEKRQGKKKRRKKRKKRENQSISLLSLNAHRLCHHLLSCHCPRIETRECEPTSPIQTLLSSSPFFSNKANATVSLSHQSLTLSKKSKMMAKPWNQHRETITKLYIQEGRTLEDVRGIMKTEYNFQAS